jgi:hypothetical protein
MRVPFFLLPVIALSWVPDLEGRGQERSRPSSSQIRVFLDCESCFLDFLRTEVAFVDYVRDRAEADVHVLITDIRTASGGREYTVAFMGTGRFADVQRTLTTATAPSDAEDVVRRQLATTLRVGLLDFATRGGVPPDLGVTVRLGGEGAASAPSRDPWNHWVFSLRGLLSLEAQESSRERQLGGRFGADRITEAWKATFGAEISHEREEFDLDDESPVRVDRRERDFEWLVVKGLGEHWSVGARGEVESSTFDNTALRFGAAPAVEYNVFPYSMYTRRQLRAQYSAGVGRVRYYEETIFGVTQETLSSHEVSLAYEQRERWGSLDARVEWSQYLHDLDKRRLEGDAEVSLRLRRGLSIDVQISGSRIHDQLSLPRRGATPEEILLRQRRLASSYEYELSLGMTYSFGSIFSSIVNPRFGE